MFCCAGDEVWSSPPAQEAFLALVGSTKPSIQICCMVWWDRCHKRGSIYPSNYGNAPAETSTLLADGSCSLWLVWPYMLPADHPEQPRGPHRCYVPGAWDGIETLTWSVSKQSKHVHLSTCCLPGVHRQSAQARREGMHYQGYCKWVRDSGDGSVVSMEFLRVRSNEDSECPLIIYTHSSKEICTWRITHW